jgi:hypothetical protein
LHQRFIRMLSIFSGCGIDVKAPGETQRIHGKISDTVLVLTLAGDLNLDFPQSC